MCRPGGQKEADGAKKGVLDINEQIVQTNALLVETLGKLSRAEGEIQSLQQEKEELVDKNKELRKQKSGECNTLTKENADLEKERHRLRNRIEELENEIDGLKERVRELEATCSATDAIHSGSDEAGERVKTSLKTEARNFAWKSRNKQTAETRNKDRSKVFVYFCIEICETSGYAYGFKHDLIKKDCMKRIGVSKWYFPWFLSGKTPTSVLLDQSMQLRNFGLEAEESYVDMLEKECDDFFLFRLRQIRNKNISEKGLKLSDEQNLKRVSVSQVYQNLIQCLKDHFMEMVTTCKSGIQMCDIKWILIVPAEMCNQGINFMEEAAMQAGLPWENLATVYAPIASIVYAENLDDEDKKYLNVLGTSIVVVDAKEIVQITVYQRGRGGELREILAANNLPCGKAAVDAAFENFIAEIVGSRVWSKYRTEEPSNFLRVQRDWHSLTTQYVASDGRLKRIRLPYLLIECFKKCTDYCLSDAVKATKYASSVGVINSYLEVDFDVWNSFFQPSLDLLTSNISTVLENAAVANDAVLLLVGDLAECNLVQESIKHVFSGNRVIIPRDGRVSAMKGGVLYGLMYE